jgi:AcrR family transcriptional regulator
MMGRPATNKREKLVLAAMDCFHAQGYLGTSLADVATAAGLAAGNVFYYFRTKEELALAVVEARCRQQAQELAALEAEPDPWRRLERFVEGAAERREGYLNLGCPLAGLARDLGRESEALRAETPQVYAVQHDWVRAQFASLGFVPDDAEAHARVLMASHHGAILMAYAQGDEGPIASGVSFLLDWLRGLRLVASVPPLVQIRSS